MIQNRERIHNTRKSGVKRERPERAPLAVTDPPVIAFSQYTDVPDENGVILRHLAPVNYETVSLRFYINSTDATEIEIGLDGIEFIRVPVAQGLNEVPFNRIVPGGSRVTVRFVDGATGRGIWAGWTGFVSV